MPLSLVPRPVRRPRAALLALGLGLTLASVQPVAPASAARLPDLKIASVTAADTAERGSTLVVRETTRNAGKAKARKSQTSYHLSKDRSLSGKDRLLGTRSVGALRPGKNSTASTELDVPAATPTGSWFVLACADGRKQVKEAKEGNNCTATASKVSVSEPTGTTFPMDPDPLTVGSTLQSGRSVSRMLYPHQDETLVATAEDGTTYTLTMPAGALLGPEQVTMTPVASVSGLPLSGGLVAGVQLEPHGLMLLEPASLTIESPDAGPLAQQTAFLFHEDGEDLHPYPMEAPEPGDDANVVRLALSHFSTPGVGSGTAADRATMESRVPSRTQSQVQSAISGILSQERANQLNGGEPNPDVGQQAVEILNQFHDDVVREHMLAAETDKNLAAAAIAEGLSWSRQVQLLGDEDNPRHAEIMERVEKILRNVKDESWAECQDHDLRAILDLLRVARTAALFGYAWEQEASDKAFGCARFEIRFDSLVTSSSSWSGNLQTGSTNGSWHTKGTVVTELFQVDNRGPLTWAGFSWTMQNTITDPDSTCHLSETGVSTAPGQLRAAATPMLGSLNAFEGGGTPPPVPVFSSVNLVPDATPTETYQHTSCDGSTTTSTDSRWAGHYESTGKNWTTDPTQQAEDFIDSRTFTVVDDRPGSSVNETTTVEVWHKPQA